VASTLPENAHEDDEGAAVRELWAAFGPVASRAEAPDVEPGQALVEVRASAVNPSDVKNVAGVFKASLPRVPGRDYAGVVAAGEGWTGKEVWGSGAGFGVTRDGADAQYVVVDLDALSVDLALDTVGGPLFEPSLRSLRPGGRQVAIASVGNGRVEFNLVDFYHKSGRLIGVNSVKLTGPEIAKIMDKLRAGFADGHLRPSPVETWPFDRGVEAYAAVARGTASEQVLRLA
jgi:NADPH:quinone reductase-like Zn-dependent oxidoreductase